MMSPSAEVSVHAKLLTASDQQVAGERRGGRALALERRPVEADLQRQAGVVVADLRTADHDRRAGRGARPVDQQDVRCEVAPRERRCRRGAPGSRTPEDRKLPFSSRTSPFGLLDRHVRADGGLARRRGRRLGIVALAQVLVDVGALALAELVARGVEEHRVRDLLAAALAEELRLDRVERVDVAAVERPRVRPVRAVPLVDADEVGVDVAQDLPALAAGLLERLVLLLDDLVADLRGRRVLVEAEDEVDGRRAGEVDRARDPVVARLVEQQAAVLRGHVAGAEDHAGVGGRVDVRHAVAVAPDPGGQRGAAGGGRDRLVGQVRRVVHRLERGGLEEAAAVGARGEHRVGDVRAERGQAVVHPRLGVGRQHPGLRGPGHAGLGLPVWDDVELGRGGGDARASGQGEHRERGGTAIHVWGSLLLGRRGTYCRALVLRRPDGL